MLSVLFNKDRSKPFVRDRHTYSYNRFTDRHRDRDRDRLQNTRQSSSRQTQIQTYAASTQETRYGEHEGENSNLKSLLVR